MNTFLSKTRDIYLGKAQVTDEIRYKIAVYTVMLIHISYIFIFALIYCDVLFFYNLVTIPFYFLILYLLQHGRNNTLCFSLLYIEIATGSLLSCIVVGWTFGFSLYNLAMVPVAFYMAYMSTGFKRKTQSAILWALGNIVVTILVRMYVYTRGAIYTYEYRVSLTISTYNMVVCFLLVTSFSILYIVEIRNSRLALERKNKDLKQIANYDQLTRLFNRYSMQSVLESVFRQAREEGVRFCIVLCDIDDFKAINDSFGHPVGDLVLQEIASIFRKSIQVGDTVCRWGGEEFLFIVNRPIEQAAVEMDKIRRLIHKRTFNAKNTYFRVSLTFGLTAYQPDDQIEDMVKRADDRLYYGKQNGKNCVVVEMRDAGDVMEIEC